MPFRRASAVFKDNEVDRRARLLAAHLGPQHVASPRAFRACDSSCGLACSVHRGQPNVQCNTPFRTAPQLAGYLKPTARAAVEPGHALRHLVIISQGLEPRRVANLGVGKQGGDARLRIVRKATYVESEIVVFFKAISITQLMLQLQPSQGQLARVPKREAGGRASFRHLFELFTAITVCCGRS